MMRKVVPVLIVIALLFQICAAESFGTVNPSLADWSAPTTSYATRGKNKAENALNIPPESAGQVMRVESAHGEWIQMIVTEAGEYSFSVDTDQLEGNSLDLAVWRYRDEDNDKDLKKTDILHYDRGQGIVTLVIRDVYAGETLFWCREDNGSFPYLLMVSPGNCAQIKQEITGELEENQGSVAPDDGLNGQPVITATPKAGDTFVMGWYEQDNDFTNGRERIEWTVLNVNEKKDEMLVISSLALDCILYHPSRIVVKWEDSAIRSWLNFDFAMTSLSSEELACIIPQKVAGVMDTVTMLDANQIKKYKLDKDGCLVSEYAANKDKPVNVAENGRGCWWVREDKTRKGGWTSFVGRHGKVYQKNYTTSSDNGVRPAMTLSISALKNCRLGPDFTVLLGEVVDASNPTRKIGGAAVTVDERTVTTDQHGRFVLDVEPGNYAYHTTLPDYIDASGTFTVRAGSQNVYQIPVCRKMADNEYRIVLTWGLNPADLDSHLTGETEGGSAYHVFYMNLTEDGRNALLEWDDVDSYGPETTHFLAYPGRTYYFSIHDYTNRGSRNSDAMARSGARVVVYHADAEIASFDVPAADATVWNVFMVKDNELTPINQTGYCEDPRLVR